MLEYFLKKPCPADVFDISFLIPGQGLSNDNLLAAPQSLQGKLWRFSYLEPRPEHWCFCHIATLQTNITVFRSWRPDRWLKIFSSSSGGKILLFWATSPLSLPSLSSSSSVILPFNFFLKNLKIADILRCLAEEKRKTKLKLKKTLSSLGVKWAKPSGSIQIICKVSGWTGKCLGDLKSFWMNWKVSRRCKKCPDNLENVSG